MKLFQIFLVGACFFAYVYAIYGGENTTIETYPYAVRFETYGFPCMGFIATAKYVVTAAHCTKECPINITNPCICKVYAGATERSKGLPFEISATAEHEKFDIKTLENNIGIAKLQKYFIFTSTIQPIQFSNNSLVDGTTVYIVGWGISQIINQYKTTLQVAELKTINHAVCVDKHYPIFNVTNNMTCAEAPTKDACMGDGGGPLIYKNSSGAVVVGLIFYTEEPCGKELDHPVVALNMSTVISWIPTKIAELDRCKSCDNYCPITTPVPAPAIPTLSLPLK